MEECIEKCQGQPLPERRLSKERKLEEEDVVKLNNMLILESVSS